MLSITKDEKTIAEAYKFLSDVPDTNLPKIKQFIKRSQLGNLYVDKRNNKIISCMFIEFFSKHISMTNLYVDKKYRFQHSALREIFETVRRIQRNNLSKKLFLTSSNVNDYKHFVVDVGESKYRIRDL